MSKLENNPYSQLLKYTSISFIFSLLGFIFAKMFIPPRIISLANIFIIVFFTIALIASLISKKGYGRFWTIKRVYTYAFINGICLYPPINYYAYSLGMNTVTNIFIGSIIVFTGLCIYAKNKNTEKVLSFGPVFLFTLLGLTIVSFINIFMRSNIIELIISSISIVLFCVYTLHSMNLFKLQLRYTNLTCADDYAIFVINLYTDFINLFLNILRFLNAVNKMRD